MTPAAPAIRLPAVADADDPSVPDYVRELEQAAHYLPHPPSACLPSGGAMR